MMSIQEQNLDRQIDALIQEVGLEEVKSAVENQTVFDRDHFTSNYDA